MSLSKKENIEKLILIVKNNPILYDMTLPEFKDAKIKDHIWNTVSNEMNGETGNTI